MTRRWYPFTYDQCHVGCKTCRRGKLWYIWDEPTRVTKRIICDQCVPEFHPDQLEMDIPA